MLVSKLGTYLEKERFKPLHSIVKERFKPLHSTVVIFLVDFEPSSSPNRTSKKPRVNKVADMKEVD